MFRHILVNNPNEALDTGLWHLKTAGVVNDSRNGRVVQAPGPVCTTYLRPTERVVFSGLRDANPFFHLYEALWMLAGKKDAASVSRFAKQMESFADGNGQLWGAYGWRWREFFGFDQLQQIIALLRADPKTRRAVLSMWSAIGDLVPVVGGEGGMASKDVPCNTHVYFDATQGRLDMTVCNRSNDIIWGAYGANAVHMSVLQEFIASAVSLPVGVYHQFSNNYHAYIDRPDVQRLIDTQGDDSTLWRIKYFNEDRYSISGGPVPKPLLPEGADRWAAWLEECEQFVGDPYRDGYNWTHSFIKDVASPLMRAHAEYKAGDIGLAIEIADTCSSADWSMAACEWLQRRQLKDGAA